MTNPCTIRLTSEEVERITQGGTMPLREGVLALLASNTPANPPAGQTPALRVTVTITMD